MPVASVVSPAVPPPGPPRQGKRPRWLIFVLLGLLVLIGGVGTYLAFFRSAPPPEQPAAPVTQAPLPAPPPAPLVPSVPATTAAERDRIRYGDISTLQSMLKLYAADNGARYPVSPLPLVLGGESSKSLSSAGFAQGAQGTTYLGEVPQNPEPGGAPYLYESADGVSYSLSFSLEEGAGGLSAGDHQAGPAGIDQVAATAPPAGSPPGTPRTTTPPAATVDTDQDGLTDAEEPLLGADPSKIDTDGDTYSDGLEVASGFNPAAGSGARLETSSALGTYQSSRFGYTVRYPKAWLARATDTEGSEVVFTGADATEFMEVLVVDNPEHLSAAAWYAKQVTGLASSEVPTVTLGTSTWAQSLDGLNAYLATDRYIITLSYNIGTRTQASYYTLFKAMLSLFSVSPETEPATLPGPANVNSNTNSSGSSNPPPGTNTNSSP